MSRTVSKPFDLGVAPSPATALPLSVTAPITRAVVKPAVYEAPKPSGAVPAFPSMLSVLPDLIPAPPAMPSVDSKNIY